MAGADHIEGGVEKMKRAGRKLIGMAAAWLLAASAFSTAVYAADGFSSEYERLLDTANILSDEEQDEITELLDELSERQKMDVTIATVNGISRPAATELLHLQMLVSSMWEARCWILLQMAIMRRRSGSTQRAVMT